MDSIFTEARKSIFGGGKITYAFAGVESPYNHGNQPSLHIPWLFNFSGKPYLTQKWTRLICDEFYGTNGEHGYGYGQDEDQAVSYTHLDVYKRQGIISKLSFEDRSGSA